jgi:hypothetical protein
MPVFSLHFFLNTHEKANFWYNWCSILFLRYCISKDKKNLLDSPLFDRINTAAQRLQPLLLNVLQILKQIGMPSFFFILHNRDLKNRYHTTVDPLRGLCSEKYVFYIKRIHCQVRYRQKGGRRSFAQNKITSSSFVFVKRTRPIPSFLIHQISNMTNKVISASFDSLKDIDTKKGGSGKGARASVRP